MPPDDLGIGEGSWVTLYTPRKPGESVRLKARFTDGIDPRVVSAAYGWWFPERPGPEHGCFRVQCQRRSRHGSALGTDLRVGPPQRNSVPGGSLGMKHDSR